MTHRCACALLLAISALAACGGGRTTAATQPSPAAFDPAKSDPKAVAAIDAMLGALGEDPSPEHVDEFLADFGGLIDFPMTMH